MKRYFALLLSAAMLLGLAGCGGKKNSTTVDATASATVPTAAPTAVPTVEVTEPAPQSAVTTETVLVDNDQVRFAVLKAEDHAHLGMQLHIQCENKTDRALMFSWDMVSVCGYMYDPLWAVEVAAGKIANDTIGLDTYALEQMGIASVDEITFTLRISDAENWMGPPIVEEAFTIYPTGLNADTVVLPLRISVAGETVIADDNNVRFVIEGAEKASGYTLRVYMENKTDRNLMYAWDQVSVNGFMIDPFWAMSVAAGKRACAEITFSGAELEANGIADVSEIEFTLLASDYDDWAADCLLKETYLYQP